MKTDKMAGNWHSTIHCFSEVSSSWWKWLQHSDISLLFFSGRVRSASFIFSALFFKIWGSFLCKWSLPHICCCLVNELLHNFCPPTFKKQFQCLMFYCTGIKADSSCFKYFCIWRTSLKTSQLIKDNSGENCHTPQRAKSELVLLWIMQFFKGWG